MQLLAMLTMLVDHIGYIFFPEQALWRIVGRMSFPLYVYSLVQGHQRTSSHSRYILRLLGIAFLSQIPYMLAFHTNELNIVFTLLVGGVLLYILDRLPPGLPALLIIALVCILAEVFPLEYGAYGLLLILMFYYVKSGRKLVMMHIILNLGAFLSYGWVIQQFSIIPTLLIVYGPSLWKKLEARRVPSWIWRMFYPVHLAVLALIFYWVNG